MANRLINESSPYLQQHAHNPVDWYPWGKEAFDRAARENKPVLLSIGYSTCHWCHVMERESFENEDTARLMNKEFVSIKVDREERPDLDHLYMEAAQAMTGRGGWPLTVFLTPEGVPFFAGTYFPPQDTMGMPGFPKVLITVAGSYHNQHARISEASESIVSYLNQAAGKQESPESLEADLLKQAYLQLSESFDREHGGFGKEPKFPQPMVMEFLLRYFIRSQEPQALEMVEKTLLEIARGGIHDQIGGGFHRYSTDARWLVPHFEKMLYDNALLSRIFLHAFQVTGKAIYSQVARKTLEYVLREMTGAEGGFFSAQDADSEGEEGKYYVWTDRQIDRVLGSKEGEIIRKYYGVTQDGNYEGNNILYIHADPKDLAGEYNLKLPELETLITDARSRLLSEREKRVHPGRDDKVLVVWNCLTVAAFAEAGQVLGENRYIKAAETCASLLLDKLWKDRNLLRVYNKGLGRVPAFLEDYASLGEGLLTLYEVTLQPRWFEEALGVASVMVEKFWDTSGGCFYDTANDAESLFYRPRNTFDNASPSGLSQASSLLLRLGNCTGNQGWKEIAIASLGQVAHLAARYPQGFGNWLCAMDFHLSSPVEITVIGNVTDARTRDLLRAVHKSFLPGKIVRGWDPEEGPPSPMLAAFLEGKTMVDGAPAAYVCRQYACLPPTTVPSELLRQITPCLILDYGGKIAPNDETPWCRP